MDKKNFIKVSPGVIVGCVGVGGPSWKPLWQNVLQQGTTNYKLQNYIWNSYKLFTTPGRCNRGRGKQSEAKWRPWPFCKKKWSHNHLYVFSQNWLVETQRAAIHIIYVRVLIVPRVHEKQCDAGILKKANAVLSPRTPSHVLDSQRKSKHRFVTMFVCKTNVLFFSQQNGEISDVVLIEY